MRAWWLSAGAVGWDKKAALLSSTQPSRATFMSAQSLGKNGSPENTSVYKEHMPNQHVATLEGTSQKPLIYLFGCLSSYLLDKWLIVMRFITVTREYNAGISSGVLQPCTRCAVQKIDEQMDVSYRCINSPLTVRKPGWCISLKTECFSLVWTVKIAKSI